MKPSDCDFQHECPDTFAKPDMGYPDDFFYYVTADDTVIGVNPGYRG